MIPCRLSSLCPGKEQYNFSVQRMKILHKKRWEFSLLCPVNLLEWESDFWDGLSWVQAVYKGGRLSEILSQGRLEKHMLSYPRLRKNDDLKGLLLLTENLMKIHSTLVTEWKKIMNKLFHSFLSEFFLYVKLSAPLHHLWN